MLNRMKTVSDGSSYQYDQNGNTTKVVFANGTETAYVFDALNRLTQVDHADSATGTLFDQQLYDLLPSGHRTRITEFSGRVVDYFYDDLYRLTSEQTTDAVLGNRTTAFTYDKVGNRQSRNDDGVITTYVYVANDRMTSETTAAVTTTYTFDDQGNTLNKSDGTSTTSFAHDPQHRVIEADSGSLITFAYDIAGTRQERADSSGTTSYIVDANRDYAQVIEEQGASNVTYTYGLDLLSQNRGAATSYYHYDGLGSTRTLTDSSGAVTDTYVYKAFGTIEAHNGLTDNDYLFAGEQYDDGLAQYYLRARYYDPSSGRFTQMDTFSGMDRDPITLHKYLYVNASPGMFVDPSGLFTISGMMTSINIASNAYSIGSIGFSFLTGNFTGGAIQIAEEVVSANLGRLRILSKLSPQQFNLLANRWARGIRLTLGSPASSRILRNNMEAIFGAAPSGHQAHHIVGAVSDAGKRSRTKLKKLGIDVNSPSNGVFLPGCKGSGIGTIHCGKHTKVYEELVFNLLESAQTKEEAVAVLNDLRHELLSRTLRLNSR